MRLRLAPAVAIAALLACDEIGPGPGPGETVVGTWGGTEAGLIATDSSAHLHIACTYGNTKEPIVLDDARRFSVAGVYNITAHPVDIGVFHPALLTGVVYGSELVITVALTDTAVVLGPVRLRLGVEPGFTNCPICRADGAGRLMPAGTRRPD